MAALYKIQIREHARGPFRDYVEWCPCSDCIKKLRDIFHHHPEWELQVVDEEKIVVTSTVDPDTPYGVPRASCN